MTKKKYYFVYKITCLKGRFKDHYYIGKHVTNDLNDHYKGSGKKIWDYYKKHPNDYVKEILCFCNSNKELNKTEYDIVHQHLNDPMCLNIAEGGHGYPLENLTEEEKQATFEKISKSNKHKVHINNGIISKMINPEDLSKYLEKGWIRGRITDYIDNEYLEKQRQAQTGKNHTEETKEKISKGNKNKERSEKVRQQISNTLKEYYKTHEPVNKNKRKV